MEMMHKNYIDMMIILNGDRALGGSMTLFIVRNL